MKKGTTEMSIHNNDLFGKNKYDTTIERIKTYCYAIYQQGGRSSYMKIWKNLENGACNSTGKELQ